MPRKSARTSQAQFRSLPRRAACPRPSERWDGRGIRLASRQPIRWALDPLSCGLLRRLTSIAVPQAAAVSGGGVDCKEAGRRSNPVAVETSSAPPEIRVQANRVQRRPRVTLPLSSRKALHRRSPRAAALGGQRCLRTSRWRIGHLRSYYSRRLHDARCHRDNAIASKPVASCRSPRARCFSIGRRRPLQCGSRRYLRGTLSSSCEAAMMTDGSRATGALVKAAERRFPPDSVLSDHLKRHSVCPLNFGTRSSAPAVTTVGHAEAFYCDDHRPASLSRLRTGLCAASARHRLRPTHEASLTDPLTASEHAFIFKHLTRDLARKPARARARCSSRPEVSSTSTTLRPSRRRSRATDVPTASRTVRPTILPGKPAMNLIVLPVARRRGRNKLRELQQRRTILFEPLPCPPGGRFYQRGAAVPSRGRHYIAAGHCRPPHFTRQ